MERRLHRFVRAANERLILLQTYPYRQPHRGVGRFMNQDPTNGAMACGLDSLGSKSPIIRTVFPVVERMFLDSHFPLRIVRSNHCPPSCYEKIDSQMTYVLLLVGLVILVVGAELLVRGSVTLASFAGVSPLIIGLTVVAFGTSAPELAVSSVSSLKGDSEIALGNVIGSNICNILLILGISAVIVPLAVSSQLVRLDVPVMIASSIAVWATAYDGAITRVEGILLFLSFILYTIYMIRKGRREEASRRSAIESAPDFKAHPTLSVGQGILNAIYILVGLGMLVLGAQLLVDSAVRIATEFGISEIVIGLTIVAIGTSLPELATSVVAAMKGQRDLAVGNAVGSNMFNLMIVLPAAGDDRGALV